MLLLFYFYYESSHSSHSNLNHVNCVLVFNLIWFQMTPVFFIIVLEFYLYLYPLNPLSICLILIKYAAAAKSLQSCTTLYDLIDSSPPGSSVPGILQARTLEWVAISFSNTCMPAMSLQSCLTMCNAIDSSPPGSVHMILQVRILEWIAISFSNKV